MIMKNIKTSIGILGLAALMFCSSCGKKNTDESDSGSDSQTTANDSSGAESRSAVGVGEGNQKDVGGYPSNQSNLTNDSTSKVHDDDTTSNKPLKDKPNKHQ